MRKPPRWTRFLRQAALALLLAGQMVLAAHGATHALPNLDDGCVVCHVSSHHAATLGPAPPALPVLPGEIRRPPPAPVWKAVAHRRPTIRDPPLPI